MVVLAREASRRGVVRERRARARNLVGGDRDADARAADRDAQIRVALRDGPAHRGTEIGVVHRIRRVARRRRRVPRSSIAQVSRPRAP